MRKQHRYMIYAFAACCAVAAGAMLAGCKTVYLESVTPPGQIEPVAPSIEPAPAPEPAPAVEPSAGVRLEPRPAPPPPAPYTPMPPAPPAPRARLETPPPPSRDAREILSDFEEAYAAKNSPRIAVFLNRELSAEVREWYTPSRQVISGTRTDVTTVGGKEEERRERHGGESVYEQTHVENAARCAPAEEAWMWAFEDGFLQPLIEAGTQIVDRATIMRLAAATSGKQGSAYDPITVKKVEMDALQGYADIFVEILVSASSQSEYGYDFKATAKEIKTGRLIANVTSLRWPPGRFPSAARVSAGPHGYDMDYVTILPPVIDVARDLGFDLMKAMSRAWRR